MKQEIILERPQVQGSALAVEQCVARVIAQPEDTDAAFNELYQGIPIGGDTVSAYYRRAQRYRQAAYAATVFTIGRSALPAMSSQLTEHGTLLPEPGASIYEFDDTVPPPEVDMRHPAHIEALRGCHWLTDHAKQTLDGIQQPNHPSYALGRHLMAAKEEYYQRFTNWKAGPGEHRWPAPDDILYKDAEANLAFSLNNNVDFALELLASRAVSHLIHINPDADSAELDQVISRNIPRLGWNASADRHLGWSRDWQAKVQQGIHIGMTPNDGVDALLQSPVDTIVSSNRFAASIDGLPVMKNRDFCPHRLLSDGPVTKAGMCAGNTWARYPDESDRQATQAFFSHADIKLDDGWHNFTYVALAMGIGMMRATILPAYEQNRLAGHP